MRNISLRLRQAVRHFLGGLGNRIIRESGTGDGRRSGHGFLSRCRRGQIGSTSGSGNKFFDIGGDNAAVGSGTGNGRNIETHFLGNHASQGGCYNLASGCDGSRRCCCRSSRRDCSRWWSWRSLGDRCRRCCRCWGFVQDIVLKSGGILFFFNRNHDRRTYLKFVASGANQNSRHKSVVLCFEIDGCLIGFYTANDITGTKRITFLHVPTGNGSRLHRRRKCGKTDKFVMRIARKPCPEYIRSSRGLALVNQVVRNRGCGLVTQSDLSSPELEGSSS
mmetsp:Transcript_1453/g.3351  ORF Transcript_1453/g.3351 Transcript_1453/m.3351 type:complete len:277 (+) Transcript_1453:690-1520(+)